MGKYGIPAQRYRPVIATAFGSSLKYDRWENGREIRHEFRDESIIITEVHFRLIQSEK